MGWCQTSGGGVAYQKISINLSEDVIKALKEMAQQDNVTMTEVIRRSISTQKFLDNAQREGKYILLEDKETKRVERVIFR
jgi:predicted transcriptional regulator